MKKLISLNSSLESEMLSLIKKMTKYIDETCPYLCQDKNYQKHQKCEICETCGTKRLTQAGKALIKKARNK